ncbi:glycosyltransferase [Clostridiaceae bacterium M8S5]|nr:glycosyltransferase [Clostridiaceae bacterium M8S5]
MGKNKRILFISKTRQNYTNILRSIFYALVEMDYHVREVDVSVIPRILYNPHNFKGGNGPVNVSYKYIKHQVETFKPHMIMLVAGGLSFSEATSEYLKNKGIKLLGITLSDPDVFPTVKKYASRFNYHTTNSKIAYQRYKKLGLKNTYYMPFGIDSRFFVPTKIEPKYVSDVTVMGHYRPERLALVKELKKRFDTKIYGFGWPYKNVRAVDHPEWLKVVNASKVMIDFPQTGAGYYNVKVRLFEVTATGTFLITKKIKEIGEFFEYGKEIESYENNNELYQKIRYYLDNPKKREEISVNGQKRCALDHTWVQRLRKLFNEIKFI